MDWTALKEQCGGVLIEHAPMSEYTTWRIGGPADALLLASDGHDVARGLAFAKAQSLPVLVIGNGSNLLVRDGGIRGLVIKIGEAMQDWSCDGTTVRAQAGCILAKLARATARRGLAGLEWAAGIPASLGGAAVMNAGAFGHFFYEVLQAVEIVDENGELQTLGSEALTYGYRSTALMERGVFVTAVTLALQAGDAASLSDQVEETLRQRREKQPLDLPSAGSVFKNPPDDHAGRLVEAAGLRGLREGQVQVSPKHGNFIVNLGGGTARDVLTLMERVKGEVRAQFGVELCPEVRIIGSD